MGRLAVLSNVGGKSDVWVIDDDGTSRRLTDLASIPTAKTTVRVGERQPDGTRTWKERRVPWVESPEVLDVALSPDGMWAAYSLNTPGRSGFEIWVRPADGTREPVLLTEGCTDTEPTWFPDSKRVAFARRRETAEEPTEDIYVVNREEHAPARLLARLEGEDWLISDLTCSPDGKTILFTRINPTPPGGGYMTQSIWKLDVESGEVAKLPLEGESVDSPAWFPDGSGFAYCALVKRKDPQQMRRCKPDGSNPEILMLEPTYSPRDPTVSPDGRYVLFVSEYWSVFHTWMYALEVETRDIISLTPKGKFRWKSPSWGPKPAQQEEAEE